MILGVGYRSAGFSVGLLAELCFLLALVGLSLESLEVNESHNFLTKEGPADAHDDGHPRRLTPTCT